MVRGGTFEGDPKLSHISLKWVLQGADDAGVLLKKSAFKELCGHVSAATASAPVHTMSPFWVLLGYRTREIWSKTKDQKEERHHRQRARVHASVRTRLLAVPEYKKKWKHTFDDVEWVDADWADNPFLSPAPTVLTLPHDEPVVS